LVVKQSDFCERLMGALYSAEAIARGVTTDRADIIAASIPTRMLEKAQVPVWNKLREDRKDYYQALTDAEFALDFAEDGAGLGLKYRRTASGYYIDVGASDMVIDGRIAVRSGHGVESLTETGVRLTSGEALPADIIIYATGYGTMSDWIGRLFDDDTADRVGPCWGYGSGTKGDPGPWIGEQRNMWVETAQPGLWLTGGNLSQARFCSRLLGLQLKRRLLKHG
jgi:putative flavoprotein involved in K+ transport